MQPACASMPCNPPTPISWCGGCRKGQLSFGDRRSSSSTQQGFITYRSSLVLSRREGEAPAEPARQEPRPPDGMGHPHRVRVSVRLVVLERVAGKQAAAQAEVGIIEI